MNDRLGEIKKKQHSHISTEVEHDRQWLIAEVERLCQKEIELSKIIGDHVDIGEGRIKQIKSLTQQLEEANHILMDIPANSNPDLMIRKLTKERDGLKEEIRISQGIKDGSYTAPKEGWTCYHCGVTFRKLGAASDHFGEVPRDKAKCQYHDLDVEKLETENFELKAAIKMMQVLGNKQADKLVASEKAFSIVKRMHISTAIDLVASEKVRKDAEKKLNVDIENENNAFEFAEKRSYDNGYEDGFKDASNENRS